MSNCSFLSQAVLHSRAMLCPPGAFNSCKKTVGVYKAAETSKFKMGVASSNYMNIYNLRKHRADTRERTLASCTSEQSGQHHEHSKSFMQVPSMPFCSRIFPRTDVRHHMSKIGTNCERAYITQLSPSCSAFLPNT